MSDAVLRQSHLLTLYLRTREWHESWLAVYGSSGDTITVSESRPKRVRCMRILALLGYYRWFRCRCEWGYSSQSEHILDKREDWSSVDPTVSSLAFNTSRITIDFGHRDETNPMTTDVDVRRIVGNLSNMCVNPCPIRNRQWSNRNNAIGNL